MSDTDKKIAEIKDGIGMLTSCAITIKRLVKEKEALVNQLKECREEIDRLREDKRKNKRQPDVAEELRVWLEEYGIETPEGGYALNLPDIGPAIRKLRKQAIESAGGK